MARRPSTSDTFPSDTARNLGVVFDSDFNFRQHISQVCKSCFYHIRKTISTAITSIRLDYCNSLLTNIAKRKLVQRVKDFLPRVVLIAPLFSPSLPLLKQCTGFLLLTEWILSCPLLHIVLYLYNNHPTCLFFRRQVRSSISQQHILPKTKLNLGKRAFCVAGSGMNSPSL